MLLPVEDLKKLILSSGVLKPEDWETAAREASRIGMELPQFLIASGSITREYFYEILSRHFKLPLARLETRTLSPEFLQMLSHDVVRARRALVFGRSDDGKFLVAMENPSDLETIEFLERKLGGKVEPHLASPEELAHALGQLRARESRRFEEEIEGALARAVALREERLEVISQEVSIVTLMDTIISYAASQDATDIHVEPLEARLLVRFRIDGVLREMLSFAKAVHPAIVARVKVLASLQIDEHRQPQDGRFRFTAEETPLDIRVSVMPTFFGEKIALRLLRSGGVPISFAELGFSPADEAILDEELKKSYGMALATGPTGCGKTTTLYAMLQRLNRPEVNITTVEDPIEYAIPFVNQTQVNPKAGLTFATGLRSLLRQDPDIMLVGEIRDSETAETAVHAALTGHLVLSTLHTNDAATAIPRLMDLGVQPFLLSASLNFVIAQRLARRICKICVQSYVPEKSLLATIQAMLKETGEETKTPHPTLLFRGQGCPSCGNTGYRGRVGIFELLRITDPIRSAISRPSFALATARELAREQKMRSMFVDGLEKAQAGITTIEEVLRVIRE